MELPDFASSDNEFHITKPRNSSFSSVTVAAARFLFGVPRAAFSYFLLGVALGELALALMEHLQLGVVRIYQSPLFPCHPQVNLTRDSI
jgi:hypothetical protein